VELNHPEPTTLSTPYQSEGIRPEKFRFSLVLRYFARFTSNTSNLKSVDNISSRLQNALSVVLYTVICHSLRPESNGTELSLVQRGFEPLNSIWF